MERILLAYGSKSLISVLCLPMSYNRWRSNSLPVNWFDAVVVLVLGFGLFRGRKNGMSKEILPLFQWLAVILVSGLFYSRGGPVARQNGDLGPADQLICWRMRFWRWSCFCSFRCSNALWA